MEATYAGRDIEKEPRRAPIPSRPARPEDRGFRLSYSVLVESNLLSSPELPPHQIIITPGAAVRVGNIAALLYIKSGRTTLQLDLQLSFT